MEAIEEKEIAAQTAACMRHIGSHDEIGAVCRELRGWVQERAVAVAGPITVIFLRSAAEMDDPGGEFEVCLPVAGEVRGEGKVTVKKLPACRVAFAAVKGPYDEIPGHYSEMLAWMSAQGLEPAGAPREVYLRHPDAQGQGDAGEYVTEIQFPIES